MLRLSFSTHVAPVAGNHSFSSKGGLGCADLDLDRDAPAAAVAWCLSQSSQRTTAHDRRLARVARSLVLLRGWGLRLDGGAAQR